MKKFLFACLLFTTSFALQASDSLSVNIAKKILHRGDSIVLNCVVADMVKQKIPNTTLNVWLDNIETHQRWKFRYPVVDGEVNGSLRIGKKIPEGKYAVNFLLQQGYINVNGEIIQHNKKDTAILSVMITRNKQSIAHAVPVNGNGNFRMKSALFADTASFIFSPPGKVNKNYLVVRIQTPLDSPFTPLAKETQFITIVDAKKNVSAAKGDSSKYVFNQDDDSFIGTLPGVQVKTTKKSKIDLFNEQYSHGMFLNGEAMVIDGLDNSDLERSYSIFTFLRGRIPGTWSNRGQPSYFLDEVQVRAQDLSYLSPSEVAMIKIYRPPSHLTGDFYNANEGVAIAVYTKQGSYAKGGGRHYFLVKGYTGMRSEWN